MLRKDVNTTAITIRRKYKSYRNLCRVIGEPIKTGGAKINQLKHWANYFNWFTEGNGYVITEIYKTSKYLSNFIDDEEETQND
jgi:hypothetical protein